ncbi:MAG: MFS transporter [Planctomycetota bacterium]
METPSHSRLSVQEQRYGMRNAYIGQAMGLLFPKLLIEQSVGPLFIKTMGGSDFQAMLLASFVGLFTLLQVPVVLRVHPWKRKRFMLRSWWLSGMAAGAGILLPFLMRPGPDMVWGAIGAFFLFSLVQTCGATFWFPLLHDVVPAARRGRFFGTMRAIWSITTFCGAVAAGVFLGADPALWKFQLVFGLAILGFFGRNYFVGRIPEAGRPAEAVEAFSNWRRHLQGILERRQALVFGGYLVTLVFCAGFLQQPMILYMKSLGFATGDNVLLYGFTILGAAGALLVSGLLVDRIGTRYVFLLAHIVLATLAALVLGVRMLPPGHMKPCLVGIFIASGAAFAAADVAGTAQLFHLAPRRGRAFFLSLFNVLRFSGVALAPFTAGIVLGLAPSGWSLSWGGAGWNVYETLFAAAGAGLLASALFLFRVDNVHGESAAGKVLEE